jgi:hypothetical protein
MKPVFFIPHLYYLISLPSSLTPSEHFAYALPIDLAPNPSSAGEGSLLLHIREGWEGQKQNGLGRNVHETVFVLRRVDG